MRGCDHPDIDAADSGRTDSLDFLVLQHAKKLGLRSRGQFANFVEEYSPAVGAFKDSGAILNGTGKGTLHMAEQFAFRERLHQSGTIAGNKRA